ncbi:MAG: hypothetical protein WDN08_16295 [Rhizomicrobium sp.]
MRSDPFHDPEQVLAEFEKAGALLKGHFILSSGLHSDIFLQKALVFQDARAHRPAVQGARRQGA